MNIVSDPEQDAPGEPEVMGEDDSSDGEWEEEVWSRFFFSRPVHSSDPWVNCSRRHTWYLILGQMYRKNLSKKLQQCTGVFPSS